MWCPEGCSSWKSVFDNLRETSDQVLKLVALGQKASKDRSDKLSSLQATSCLIEGGFADNYREAELIVSITATYLMVNLLEYFPPVISNVAGNRLTLDLSVYSHKDQFESCVFSWPIKDDSQFHMFFEYAKVGNFDSEVLYSRFSFIDHETGKLNVKNGAESYLINGLGLSDELAAKYCDFVRSLDDYYVFWSEVPDEEEYRDLLGCIEVNDDFKRAINALFGDQTTSLASHSIPGKIGRPKLRDEIAIAYFSMFPAGHVAQELTWKTVALRLSASMGRTVTVATIRRGLRERDEQK